MCALGTWKIETSVLGGLGQGWQTTNSRKKGKREKEKREKQEDDDDDDTQYTLIFGFEKR